ncbi:hypothetical protein BaRGS_00001789 [Batillaria attramentaria]|uniref:Uncharacterized protein n=1 Tax=Batillaria attramentaria TaxID=370345 RepID=A0ABD0M628_9CAEN
MSQSLQPARTFSGIRAACKNIQWSPYNLQEHTVVSLQSAEHTVISLQPVATYTGLPTVAGNQRSFYKMEQCKVVSFSYSLQQLNSMVLRISGGWTH